MENDNSPIQAYLWISQTYNLARNCSIALKPSSVFAFADRHALIQPLHEAGRTTSKNGMTNSGVPV